MASSTWRGCQHSLAWGGITSPSTLCSVFMWPSPCECVSKLNSSLIRTLEMAFRAHLGNPGEPPHLQILNSVGTSLAVQWLGLRASTARALGLVAGWGTKIPQPARCSQKKKKKKILNSITSAKTLSPKKVTVTGSMDEELHSPGGPTVPPTTILLVANRDDSIGHCRSISQEPCSKQSHAP